MTLDASTPEKLREAIEAALRLDAELYTVSGIPREVLLLAAKRIADATLVAPKTQEVWCLVSKRTGAILDTYNFLVDCERHHEPDREEIVRATLTLHEEV